MKTKVIVKTSVDKLNAARNELWAKHGSRGKMDLWKYVVDDVSYLFVLLPIHVQWGSLLGFRVDEVDMEDVMAELRELELHATEISLNLMRE